MTRHAKTIRMIEEARLVLTEHNPMTVRKVYCRAGSVPQSRIC